MNKIKLWAGVVFVFSILVGSVQNIKAAGVNNVYYSAAMCKAIRSTGSNGQQNLVFQTSDGINADSGPVVGGWYNSDNDNIEELVCPIPYDKFNTKPFIVVRAVVVDNSDDNDSSGQIWLRLCGQPAEGATFCPNAANGGETGTNRSGTGMSTLTVSMRPMSNGEDLRWFWLSVRLPDIDGSRPAGSRSSGMLGYRVLRCGSSASGPDCSDVN